MKFEVVNSARHDIDHIFSLYDAAVDWQKKKFNKHWQPFDRKMIELEIDEQRQWKILADGAVAGIFAVTYNDPEVWGGKEMPIPLFIFTAS